MFKFFLYLLGNPNLSYRKNEIYSLGNLILAIKVLKNESGNTWKLQRRTPPLTGSVNRNIFIFRGFKWFWRRQPVTLLNHTQWIIKYNKNSTVDGKLSSEIQSIHENHALTILLFDFKAVCQILSGRYDKRSDGLYFPLQINYCLLLQKCK